MKKFTITIIVLLFSLINNVYSQWTVLANVGFSNEFRSVFFVNAQTGYVSGSDGIIIKTTDAGNSWVQLASGIADTLRGVCFTSDSIGYAVGAQGKIVKTTDAGTTWSVQTSGVSSLLRSVSFPAKDTGYVAGGNGIILKTTDGGVNWLPQTSGTTQDLINIRFSSVDTGYAVSSLSTFFNGLILKTVNGGANWDTVQINTHGFLGVAAISGNLAYAAGDSGTIVKTTDGGLNWSNLSSGTLNRLRTMYFLNNDTGYAAGEAGTVIYTTDGGISWTNQTIQASGLLGMHFPVPDTGYSVGIAGTILRYTKPCPLPAEPAQIFGGTTVCEGETISYYINPVSDATGYTWAGPPGSTVNIQGDTLTTITFGTASGNISVTANNICGSGIPHQLLVNVHANPAVPVITANGPFLVSTPAAGYQWYYNSVLIPGADSSFYFPQQNGNYTVIITNTFGCTSSSAIFNVLNAGITQATSPVAGISPLPFHNFFSLTPNQSTGISADLKMVIYSTKGNLVKEIRCNRSGSTIVNTEDLYPGVYFYEIKSDGHYSHFGKLMKQ